MIWDFSAVSGKANRFYLNQLELTLKLLRFYKTVFENFKVEGIFNRKINGFEFKISGFRPDLWGL